MNRIAYTYTYTCFSFADTDRAMRAVAQKLEADLPMVPPPWSPESEPVVKDVRLPRYSIEDILTALERELVHSLKPSWLE